jgi:hypothetical protein
VALIVLAGGQRLAANLIVAISISTSRVCALCSVFIIDNSTRRTERGLVPGAQGSSAAAELVIIIGIATFPVCAFGVGFV